MKTKYKTSLQEIMMCRLYGHKITHIFKWDWHKNIFGHKVRGKRIRVIYCLTCYLANREDRDWLTHTRRKQKAARSTAGITTWDILGRRIEKGRNKISSL